MLPQIVPPFLSKLLFQNEQSEFGTSYYVTVMIPYNTIGHSSNDQKPPIGFNG